MFNALFPKSWPVLVLFKAWKTLRTLNKLWIHTGKIIAISLLLRIACAFIAAVSCCLLLFTAYEAYRYKFVYICRVEFKNKEIMSSLGNKMLDIKHIVRKAKKLATSVCTKLHNPPFVNSWLIFDYSTVTNVWVQMPRILRISCTAKTEIENPQIETEVIAINRIVKYSQPINDQSTEPGYCKEQSHRGRLWSFVIFSLSRCLTLTFSTTLYYFV